MYFGPSHWTDHFRFCAACGELGQSKAWLCEDCLAKLVADLGPHHRVPSPGVDHFYLFPWVPGDRFMDRVVVSLKGGRQKRILAGLAHILASLITQDAPVICYPCKGIPDHATLLATAIADLRGLRTIPLSPLRARGAKQAHLDQQARASIQFKPHQEEFARVVIVDDVVTTGATLRGLWQALGGPEQTLVLSLFFRKSL